jgi:hypothetical protein
MSIILVHAFVSNANILVLPFSNWLCLTFCSLWISSLVIGNWVLNFSPAVADWNGKTIRKLTTNLGNYVGTPKMSKCCAYMTLVFSPCWRFQLIFSCLCCVLYFPFLHSFTCSFLELESCFVTASWHTLLPWTTVGFSAEKPSHVQQFKHTSIGAFISKLMHYLKEMKFLVWWKWKFKYRFDV